MGGELETDQIAARREPNDEQTVEQFRDLVRDRLGGLALAVLDLRLSGEGDTKSLVGADEYGRPTSYRVKKTGSTDQGTCQGICCWPITGISRDGGEGDGGRAGDGEEEVCGAGGVELGK